MKKIYANSKKGKHFINDYLKSEAFDLFDVYKNPSHYKKLAEYQIKRDMQRKGGHGYKILSANCSSFTAGYLIRDCENLLLIIETHLNTYVINITKYQRLFD